MISEQGKPSKIESQNAKPQITKRQHFVPQFYLRKFVNAEGEVEVLDVLSKRILQPRSPKAVCYEKFYYGVTTGEVDEVSQTIEEMFQEMEDKIASRIDAIIDKFVSFSQIQEDEKWLVASLMSMIWIRGSEMRGQINRLSEQMIKHVNRLKFSHSNVELKLDQMEREKGKTMSPETRERLKKMMREGDYSVVSNNAPHFHMFENFEGFANLFHGQDWVVYVSKSAKKFTTSDNPVTVVFPERQSVYGVSIS
jgi:uncharacterized protein with von Willebrand factor type A (vWA) domain